MCRTADVNRHPQEMSEPLFARLEDELFPTAELIDLRGWGESLIFPHFPDRLERAARSGAGLRVVTNLSFRRPAVLDALAAAGAHIGVSLDTADAALLFRLRRGARLDLIEANLRHLGERYARAGRSDRLCLYVTCQRPALDGLADLVEFAARCGVFDIRFAPVTTDPNSPLSLRPVEEQLPALLTRIAEAALPLGVRVSLTASLTDQSEPQLGAPACLHPWTQFCVAFDGRVGFCDHLIGPMGDEYMLGDLTDCSVEAIWNSPDWTALRRNHAARRDPLAPHFGECAWCYRNRHVDLTTFSSPRSQRNVSGSSNSMRRNLRDRRAPPLGCDPRPQQGGDDRPRHRCGVGPIAHAWTLRAYRRRRSFDRRERRAARRTGDSRRFPPALFGGDQPERRRDAQLRHRSVSGRAAAAA
ncbi:MAG: radical SAM/SPASM domain-containing protein [Sphingomonas sp.]